MTTQERFAEEYEMAMRRVQLIRGIANRCGQQNEKACNGDPHPALAVWANKDKNLCTKRWQADLDESTQQLLDTVKGHGFTGVEYTGLYPTLKRGDQFVEIPY